jgi:hypothetical protein
MLAAAQLSRYYETDNEYFCLSIAFPNISNKKESISVTIGFLNDRALKKRIRFIDDKSVVRDTVNITCERCAIMDCKVRAADPEVFQYEENRQTMVDDIDSILSEKE